MKLLGLGLLVLFAIACAPLVEEDPPCEPVCARDPAELVPWCVNQRRVITVEARTRKDGSSWCAVLCDDIEQLQYEAELPLPAPGVCG